MLNNNLIILKYNAPTIVRYGYIFQLQWHFKWQAAQTNGPGMASPSTSNKQRTTPSPPAKVHVGEITA